MGCECAHVRAVLLRGASQKFLLEWSVCEFQGTNCCKFLCKTLDSYFVGQLGMNYLERGRDLTCTGGWFVYLRCRSPHSVTKLPVAWPVQRIPGLCCFWWVIAWLYTSPYKNYSLHKENQMSWENFVPDMLVFYAVWFFPPTPCRQSGQTSNFTATTCHRKCAF